MKCLFVSLDLPVEASAVIRPSHHQLTSALEHVPTGICGLDLIADKLLDRIVIPGGVIGTPPFPLLLRRV